MRILLVHNFYGSSAPSGENRVVLEERDLLRSAGHEVIEHFTSSDTVRDCGLLPLVKAALSVPWNPRAHNTLKRRILELAPDVMHVHNVFPLLSPSIFRAAAGLPTAVVNTLHNYRTVCPAAIPLRNGVACARCVERRSVLPAVSHGCYRNSRFATLPLAFSVALHRCLQTYARHVDGLVALTEFQKNLLVRGGLPEQRIYIKPNCLAGTPLYLPWEERDHKAVFIGRISREKGLGVLLEAWARWGAGAPRLEVIGNGPELERLRHAVPPTVADRITFLGGLPVEQAHARLARAKLLIVPSVSFEAFPLVLREAFAFGVPVAASNLGVFKELVETRGLGLLFGAGNSESLRETVCSLWLSDPTLRQMSIAARAEFEARYDAKANLFVLLAIYQRSIETKQMRLQEVS